MKPNPLLSVPSDIVLEFLGGIEFRGGEQANLQMAEDIAGNIWNSLDELGKFCLDNAKNKKQCQAFINEAKTHPFFKSHF